jgi:hypothetical protein
MKRAEFDPSSVTVNPAAARAGSKLGLELEMGVVDRVTGASHPVHGYFERLAERRLARGEPVTETILGGRLVNLAGPAGHSGLDNAFNLLETAFDPIVAPDGLDALHRTVVAEIADANAALAEEGAVLLNAAEHPDCALSDTWYRSVVAPRRVYAEMAGFRGWRHQLGIDAKAQNSPCTAVPIAQAARALNTILALAPANIALFANSPLEGGRDTGLKENRLTLWDRMFSGTRFACDHRLQQLPDAPFADLGAYFRWMFGPGTVTRALPASTGASYKSGAHVYLNDNPPLGAFLQSVSWDGVTDDGDTITLAPESAHFVHAQFGNFIDARWRYRLADFPELPALLRAWETQHGLEALFAQHGVDGYIEGRAPGANFADPQLLAVAGPDICRTVTIAPSAIQLGLMRNLDDAEALVREWGWAPLAALRADAIRLGMASDRVQALARDTLAVARAGLSPEDAAWLAYAEYVTETRQTGADRLLQLWRAHEARPRDRLAQVCTQRHCLAL